VLAGVGARVRGTRLTVRITIVLAAIALLAAVNALLAVRAVDAREQSRTEVTGLRAAGAAADDLSQGIVDQESGQRGFLITGEEPYLEPYRTGGEAIAQARESLASAGASNAAIAAAIADVDAALAAWRAEAEGEIDVRRTQGGDAVAAIVAAGSGKQLFDTLRAATEELTAIVDSASDSARSDAQSTYDRFVTLVFVTLGAVVVMTAGLALLLMRWVTRPVEQLAESVQGVRAGRLDQQVSVTGPPELTTIAAAADDMRQRLVVELARAEAARAQAAAANAELEAFSYSVSHDLRAPLRAIDGFSRAMVEDAGDDLAKDLRGHLERIRANTKRMADLIDDLLELSRVSRVAPDPVEVDVSAVALEVVAGLRAADPGRVVEVVVQPGLQAVADASLLRIVLENLLGNAWKFTARQLNPRIELAGEGQAPHTMFRITDNGAGFEQAYADKLFAPFQRLHTDREFPGTGIGLATVARIVHRHGGRIRASGEVGRGATVLFCMAEPAISVPPTPSLRVDAPANGTRPERPEPSAGAVRPPVSVVGATRVLEHDHDPA
jgi:signal transduction histidine kinase